MKIDDVVTAMKEEKLSEPTIQKVVAKLKALQEESKEERAGNKVKHKFIIVICDKDKQFVGLEKVGGFVVQMNEQDNSDLLLDQISTAVKSYNTTTRNGRKRPIKTFGQAMESLPRKFSKAVGVLPKTKELTRVIVTDNQLKE
jgi:hypothetical protein